MDHLTFQEIFSIMEDQIQTSVAEEQSSKNAGRSSTNAERSRREEHLAGCAKCRKIYLGLKAITNSFGRSLDESEAALNCRETEASPNCPEDWQLAALVKGEGDRTQAAKLSAHLQDCLHCLERAAGYYKALELSLEAYGGEKELVAPKDWQERAVKALFAGKASPDKRESLFHRVLHCIQKKLTILPPLPGYVLAALAIAMLIWTNLPTGEKIIIILSSQKDLLLSLTKTHKTASSFVYN